MLQIDRLASEVLWREATIMKEESEEIFNLIEVIVLWVLYNSLACICLISALEQCSSINHPKHFFLFCLSSICALQIVSAGCPLKIWTYLHPENVEKRELIFTQNVLQQAGRNFRCLIRWVDEGSLYTHSICVYTKLDWGIHSSWHCAHPLLANESRLFFHLNLVNKLMNFR